MLDRFHPIPTPAGRVRLRLARPADRDALAALLAELGVSAGEMDLRRAVRFAPFRRWGIVATAWDGAAEQVAGFAALGDEGETVLAPHPAVRALLRQALAEHAPAWSHRAA